MPDPPLSFAGWTFLGWDEDENETDPAYPYPADETAPALYTGNIGTKLYAIWVIKTFTVTYDANGGIDAPSPGTKTYGVDLTLSAVEPTREGYFAVWQANTYIISYNNNGGTNGPTGTLNWVYDGAPVPLNDPASDPRRENYTFLGWAESRADADAVTPMYTRPANWEYLAHYAAATILLCSQSMATGQPLSNSTISAIPTR